MSEVGAVLDAPTEGDARPTEALSRPEQWLTERAQVSLEVMPDGKKIIRFAEETARIVNLLGPLSQVVQVSPHFTPRPAVIWLDRARDVYEQSKAWNPDTRRSEPRLALHAKALAKLADIAGIEHLQTDWDYMGGRGVRATVHGQMRNPDGTKRLEAKSKQVVYAHRERKIRNDAVAKWEKWNKGPWEKLQNGEALSDNERKDAKPPPTEAELQALVDQDLEFLAEKVETKAWARVIRSLLGIQPHYSEAEIAKPFLAVTYAFTPDSRDPAAQQIISAQFREGMAKLYGAPENSGVAPPPLSHSSTRLLNPGADLDEDAEDGDEQRQAQEPRHDPSSQGAAEQDEFEDADEWESAPAPARPTLDVPLGGAWAGKNASEAAQSQQGRQWLAKNIPRLRKPEKRSAILAWLSWAYGEPVDEIRAAAIAAGEVSNSRSTDQVAF